MSLSPGLLDRAAFKFGISESGQRAGGPLSTVTVLGRTHRSTDAGCREVTSLACPGPLWQDHDRATGQGHCAGRPLYSLLSLTLAAGKSRVSPVPGHQTGPRRGHWTGPPALSEPGTSGFSTLRINHYDTRGPSWGGVINWCMKLESMLETKYHILNKPYSFNSLDPSSLAQEEIWGSDSVPQPQLSLLLDSDLESSDAVLKPRGSMALKPSAKMARTWAQGGQDIQKATELYPNGSETSDLAHPNFRMRSIGCTQQAEIYLCRYIHKYLSCHNCIMDSIHTT